MDNVEKSSFQMMNIIGKKVKCSRCNNEATNITNDVPYCACAILNITIQILKILKIIKILI